MRAIRILVPVLLTIILFGGLFYVQMRSGPALPPVTDDADTTPESGSGSVITASSDTPPYTIEDALTEAAEYGQDAIVHTLLYSSMGVPLETGAEEIQLLLDASSRERLPFENPAFISVPYERGNSLLLAEKLVVSNALNFRWNTAERHTRVTPITAARGIRASVVLAQIYASEDTKGFEARALAREASEAMGFLENNLKQENGLFASAWQGERIINPAVDLSNQWPVLESYARLVDYTESFSGYYLSSISIEQVHSITDTLFRGIQVYITEDETRLTTLPQQALAEALSSLSWYASVTSDLSLQQEALQLLQDTGDALKLSENLDEETLSPGTVASKVYGYMLAYRATDDASYERAAARSWNILETMWDVEHAVYASEDASVVHVRPDELADIISALRVGQYISQSVISEDAKSDEEEADEDEGDDSIMKSAQKPYLVRGDIPERFAAILQSMVKRSGMLPSEGRESDEVAEDDGIASVSVVKKAPVFVADAIYLPSADRWMVLDGNVAIGPALDLAAELLEFSQNVKTAHAAEYGIPSFAVQEQ